MKSRVLTLTALGAFLVMAGLASTGCKKDTDPPDLPPPVVNDGELITTLNLHFTDAADTSSTMTFTFRDEDGEGGNAPSKWDTIRVVSGKAYQVSVEVLDESNSADIKDITPEILAEASEHIFCFTPTGVGIGIVRTDTDGTYEVGLQSTWTVSGAAAAGSTTVTLKHQTDGKDNTCVPGETDIEVSFVTEIL